MTKKTLFHLGLRENENIVDLTIRAASREDAIRYYELLEQKLIEFQRIDLKSDWKPPIEP